MWYFKEVIQASLRRLAASCFLPVLLLTLCSSCSSASFDVPAAPSSSSSSAGNSGSSDSITISYSGNRNLSSLGAVAAFSELSAKQKTPLHNANSYFTFFSPKVSTASCEAIIPPKHGKGEKKQTYIIVKSDTKIRKILTRVENLQ